MEDYKEGFNVGDILEYTIEEDFWNGDEYNPRQIGYVLVVKPDNKHIEKTEVVRINNLWGDPIKLGSSIFKLGYSFMFSQEEIKEYTGCDFNDVDALVKDGIMTSQRYAKSEDGEYYFKDALVHWLAKDTVYRTDEELEEDNIPIKRLIYLKDNREQLVYNKQVKEAAIQLSNNLYFGLKGVLGIPILNF